MTESASIGRPPEEAIRLENAALRFGDRTVWERLDLVVRRGEFLAVLGPNGAGKTTLLKVLLGLLPLSSGTVLLEGNPPKGGNPHIGYMPQQRVFDRDLPVRGRDIVLLGASGQRAGLPLASRHTRRLVDDALASVGATEWANAPVGQLSGGEQQRLRVAQALLGDPTVLLCDEPLASLDVAYQDVVMELIDVRRREASTAVVFVTHDINPVLPFVDWVLYLVDGRWALGAPDEVLTSERLSELYGTCVETIRFGDRLLVVTDQSGAICEHRPAGLQNEPRSR